MVTVASGLSDLIGSHGKRGEAMTEIDALWAVAKPQFSADQTDLVKTLDAEVALCRIAVERNRPADADKCYRNFLAISDSLPTI